MRSIRLAPIAFAVLALGMAPLAAQNPAPLAVGSVAPEFVLDGGTMDGSLGKPFRLSDYRDQTVVIAFFYKARTSG
ncbi:MAG: hypothetical protein ABI587_04555 [Gemmatimonadales bacterium]